jgi:hypothetical protein
MRGGGVRAQTTDSGFMSADKSDAGEQTQRQGMKSNQLSIGSSLLVQQCIDGQRHGVV